MDYDVTKEKPSLKGNFTRNASGEGFGKKTEMPLGKCEEYPSGGDSGNSKHNKYMK